MEAEGTWLGLKKGDANGYPLLGVLNPQAGSLHASGPTPSPSRWALFLSPFYRREDGKINWSTPNCTDGK